MATEESMEYLLGSDEPEAVLSEAEEWALWQRLFLTDLRGRMITFDNRGGDTWQIGGILVKIFPAYGGPIAEVGRMYAKPQLDTWEVSEAQKEMVGERYILLGHGIPPAFSENGPGIILRDGAEGIIYQDGRGYLDYGSLDIGFIY